MMGSRRSPAEARSTTITEAVREALERLLEEEKRQRTLRRLAIDASLSLLDTLADHPWTDADMHDADGLPR